jgi:hypothetical protein
MDTWKRRNVTEFWGEDLLEGQETGGWIILKCRPILGKQVVRKERGETGFSIVTNGWLLVQVEMNLEFMLEELDSVKDFVTILNVYIAKSPREFSLRRSFLFALYL